MALKKWAVYLETKISHLHIKVLIKIYLSLKQHLLSSEWLSRRVTCLLLLRNCQRRKWWKACFYGGIENRGWDEFVRDELRSLPPKCVSAFLSARHLALQSLLSLSLFLWPSTLIVVASITLSIHGETYRSINRPDNAPVDSSYPLDSRACGQSPKMQRSPDNDLRSEKFYGSQLYGGSSHVELLVSESVNC